MTETAPDKDFPTNTDPQQAPPVDFPNGQAATDSTPPTSESTGSAQPKDLPSQLAEAQAKATEYLEGWQRARAEFINYRKRADKERDEIYTMATTDTLRKLLPIIDDLDRATSNIPPELADHDVLKGFSLIFRKLTTLLDSNSIQPINPVGEPFNPALHEALGQDDHAEVPSGHVSMVLQKGYVYGDKVLRPALVRVAS